MTRAVKAKAKRRSQAPPPTKRSPWRERGLFGFVALAVVILGAALWLKSADDRRTAATDAGPVHVHGLGVNPADGALYIATHTGLYRSSEGDSKSVRVGDSKQDTMGFSVIGPDRFVGSGHPDFRTDLPPLLGLIESTNKGRSWEPISLLGDADFHVLRAVGERVYGYDASNDRLLVSADAGRTWEEVERPAPLLDLAADPEADLHLVAAGASDLGQGLYESRDGGRSWESVGQLAGLLAWPTPDRLFVVDLGGNVFVSANGGRDLEHRGVVGGQPAALVGESADELFVALHDGTIKHSKDGGRTWTVRSTP
ncbi:MAG: exo-alpha-sialidase [Actinomycetota bacterium]|nr:exo-alpha-sialidase [Actinomycetota bacterium]